MYIWCVTRKGCGWKATRWDDAHPMDRRKIAHMGRDSRRHTRQVALERFLHDAGRPIWKCSRCEGSKILRLAKRLHICTSGFWNSWANLLLRHCSAKWTGASHFCGDGRRPRTIFSLPMSFCNHPALQRNLISRQFYPPLRLQFLDLWLPGPTFLTLAGFYDLGMEYQIIYLKKKN